MFRFLVCLLISAALAAPLNAQVPVHAEMKDLGLQFDNLEDMNALLEEGTKPLTKEDVTHFLAGIKAYEKWLQEELPRLKKAQGQLGGETAHIKAFMKSGEKMQNLMVLTMRVKTAEKLSDPKERKKLQKSYETAKSEMAAAHAQLAQLPEAQREQITSALKQTLALIEPMATYPDASISL